MNTRSFIIGIMGTGESATSEDCKLAYGLSYKLAKHNFITLCGGRDVGVMKSVAKGTKDANGISIGILPGRDKQEASSNISIPVITGMGDARNNINILTSDIIVAIGSTPGTLSEISLAIKNHKKVILLNQNKELLKFLRSCYSNNIIYCDGLNNAFEIIIKMFNKS